MKIWIDLSNSPHVNFFAGMIREFRKNHTVVLTCRQLANTTELLDLHGFDFHVVGKHYGKNTLKKGLGFGVRAIQLYRFLKEHHIDVAISHSSFQSPVVARMLGTRSIYLNDNEHAAGNRIAFLFADTIMVPEYLDISKVTRQWAQRSKIRVYPGVKEGVYLWSYRPKRRPPVNATEGSSIFVRPEPWSAQYYSGRKDVLDDLLVELGRHHHVTILPRGAAQMQHFQQARFTGVKVAEQSLHLADIMNNCDLFIGAGGTMTREAAVLGIPTISTYQDSLLDVDRYLIQIGSMVHNKNLDVAFVDRFMRERGRTAPKRDLIGKGREAYDLIRDTLLTETNGQENSR